MMEKNKNYSKIVPNCDWKKKGEDNCISMMKSLSIEFLKERKREEENDGKNQKSLKVLNILYLEKMGTSDIERIFTETKRGLDKLVKYFIDEYTTMLEMAEYEKAAELYEGAVRYQKYKPLMYVCF
jgi:Zn-dependent M32 family carboxypeptidase